MPSRVVGKVITIRSTKFEKHPYQAASSLKTLVLCTVNYIHCFFFGKTDKVRNKNSPLEPLSPLFPALPLLFAGCRLNTCWTEPDTNPLPQLPFRKDTKLFISRSVAKVGDWSWGSKPPAGKSMFWQFAGRFDNRCRPIPIHTLSRWNGISNRPRMDTPIG